MAKFEEKIRKVLITASARELNTGCTTLVQNLNRGYAKIQVQLDEEQSKDTSTSTVMERMIVVGVGNFQS